MYGTRHEFSYLECPKCRCLQIAEIPLALEKYYPDDYWEFDQGRVPLRMPGRIGGWIKRRRTTYWLRSERDAVGRLFALGQNIPPHITWMRRAGVRDIRADILDVGCGIGGRLMALRSEGFSNLTGIDPFIKSDISYPSGVRILKQTVFDVRGQYDVVMLHHSFEHMPDPRQVLGQLVRLLRPSGTILIRIPILGDAWERYGTNWVQLDAPRHFYLHSVDSMRLLCEQNGLIIQRIEWDSGPFQFWGSEQYVRDIPLYDSSSYEVNPEKSIFSRTQIDGFRELAVELNRTGRGDQACFYIQFAENSPQL